MQIIPVKQFSPKGHREGSRSASTGYSWPASHFGCLRPAICFGARRTRAFKRSSFWSTHTTDRLCEARAAALPPYPHPASSSGDFEFLSSPTKLRRVFDAGPRLDMRLRTVTLICNVPSSWQRAEVVRTREDWRRDLQPVLTSVYT